MRVTVKLFAVARQLAGSETITVELPPDASVADLRTAIAEQHPALRGILAQLKFAVDQEYAADGKRLSAESEIACIPPVSGG